MDADEQSIRDLFSLWHDATAAGNVTKILPLMDDDVLFLGAGQPPMRGKEAFSSAFKTFIQHYRVHSEFDLQEIQVAGEFAYCWGYLSVAAVPLPSGQAKRRSGYTLTVLRKLPTGKWVVTRDANMMTAVS